MFCISFEEIEGKGVREGDFAGVKLAFQKMEGGSGGFIVGADCSDRTPYKHHMASLPSCQVTVRYWKGYIGVLLTDEATLG